MVACRQTRCWRRSWAFYILVRRQETAYPIPTMTHFNKATPPPRPHLLTVPLFIGQAFKHMGVWGPFLFKWPPQAFQLGSLIFWVFDQVCGLLCVVSVAYFWCWPIISLGSGLSFFPTLLETYLPRSREPQLLVLCVASSLLLGMLWDKLWEQIQSHMVLPGLTSDFFFPF